MSNKAYFTFGRWQPPTVGHQKLFDNLYEAAMTDGADNYVFCSHSHDNKTNLIPPAKKILFMEALFPNLNIVSLDYGVISPYMAARIISDTGYKNVKMFVGGDRAKEFKEGISNYINHPNPEKSYNFESFDVVDVGSRIDEDNVSQASGTAARAAALEEDFDLFATFIPTENIDIIESIYYSIRAGSNLTEAEIAQSIY